MCSYPDSTIIEEKCGPPMAEADFKDDPNFADFSAPEFEPYEVDKLPVAQMPAIGDVHDADTYDHYVGAQVRVLIGDEIRNGKVMRSKHLIEFPDGRSDEYTANVIAENMYA
jgi:hypothetical protein